MNIVTCEKSEKKLRRNIYLDYINTFITNLNMQSSIWVLYLAYCGMSLTQIGLLEGVYHITSIIFEIPSGAAADLLGRKKSIIVSKICIAISCLIMLYSKSFWLFALSFLIQSLGNNFNSGSEEALIYDSMKALGKEDQYIGVYGKLNVIIEVSQGIATVSGGILAEYSYYWCYFTSLIIALLAFVPILGMSEVVLEKTVKVSNNVFNMVKNHFITSFNILKSDQRIIMIVVYYSFIFASETVLFFYGQQYFYDLGFNKIYISMFMLLFSICSCIGALMSEKLFHYFGAKIAVIAAVIIGISIISFVLERSFISVVALSIAGSCNSLLYPIQSASLNKLIPSEQRATLISVNSMFFSIAMIIIFPIVGFIADYITLGKSLVGVGSILILFTIMLRKKIIE